MMEYILIFVSVIAVLCGSAAIIDYIDDKMNNTL